MGSGDGALTSVFIVLRKKRPRGESHEWVLEVIVWMCRGGGGCDGYTRHPPPCWENSG